MARGPFPPALAAISLRAFSSIVARNSQSTVRPGGFIHGMNEWNGTRLSHTGLLLLVESLVLVVEVLVLLLRGLKGLDLATFSDRSATKARR